MLRKASLFLSLLLFPIISNAQAAGTVKPRFQGSLHKYLTKNIQYPEKAINGDADGECLVQFMVNEKGKIERVYPVKSSGNYALDAEAQRLVAAMPDWQPGIYNNEPARFVFTLPVSFKLQ